MPTFHLLCSCGCKPAETAKMALCHCQPNLNLMNIVFVLPPLPCAAMFKAVYRFSLLWKKESWRHLYFYNNLFIYRYTISRHCKDTGAKTKQAELVPKPHAVP